MRRRSPAYACGTMAFLMALTGVAGCSGSSLSDDEKKSGPITIGLLVPQSGPYQVSGPEIIDGFQLFLDTHGGKLGGREVKTIIADEGEGKQTAINSAKKLIKQDHVDAIVGTTTVDSLLSIQPMINEAKIPFIGVGGRPSNLADLSHVWHTSYLSREPGQAIADYIRTNANGPVFAIGPDYQGGYDNVNGFVEPFVKGGGTLANENGKPLWTPWPTTTNFIPYLNKIASSNAKAVYTFYAGTAAVAFVQQYAQAGLHGKIPLYASGILTDEILLPSQGAAADGIRTVLNYAPNLDNATNRTLVVAYQKNHSGSPHFIHVTTYDAANVLNKAIGAAGSKPTGESINTAIGKIGEVDSPRGTWRWSADHSPVQTWYLREVGVDGRSRANVLVQPLTTLGRTQ